MSWFTKGQEGHKLHWASGNKVVDPYSLRFNICQSVAYDMLTQMMASAIWLELSNLRVALPKWQKMSLRTPDPLYIHTWRFGHKTSPKCSLSLHPNCVLDLHLKHSCTFAYSVCQIASQTDKPDAETLVLVSIQLLICCLQFLLWKHQTANNAYMITYP